MQLTGKQIVNSGIIGGYCEEGVQQQGVDVRVIEINEVQDQGFIPKEGKTRKCKTSVVKTESLQVDDRYYEGWKLSPGYYEVTFEESCNIPADAVLHYDARSSLVRCGGKIFSGQFDGGFHTDHMGAFMELTKPIIIEKGARVAQARVEESYPVDDENLYNGQWQNDKQRQ